MRTFVLLFAALVMTGVAFSQTITIRNSSACDVAFYLAATDGACNAYASTINYVIPAGSTMNLNFGTATWPSVTPGTGWQWQFIKAWNFCGNYNYLYPNCTGLGTANDDIAAMGIPCSGLGTTQCANMTTSCNNPGCNWIRCYWSNSGMDVTVYIG